MCPARRTFVGNASNCASSERMEATMLLCYNYFTGKKCPEVGTVVIRLILPGALIYCWYLKGGYLFEKGCLFETGCLFLF